MFFSILMTVILILLVWSNVYLGARTDVTQARVLHFVTAGLLGLVLILHVFTGV